MPKHLNLLLAVLFCSFLYAQVKTVAPLEFNKSAEKIYLNPPLEFNEAPFLTVLDTVLIKAGLQYSIEGVKIKDWGTITLKLTEKTECDILLEFLLKPKGLTFEKDSNGVYHIKMTALQNEFKVEKINKLYAYTGSSVDDIVGTLKRSLPDEAVVGFDGTGFTVTSDRAGINIADQLLNELLYTGEKTKKSGLEIFKNGKELFTFSLTILEKKRILIEWNNDLPDRKNILFYKIFRSDKTISNVGNDYLLAGNLSKKTTSFIDITPKEIGREYYYKIMTVDSSGKEKAMFENVGIKVKERIIRKERRVYNLTYSTAGEMARQVKSLMTVNGSIEVDVPSNTLIITDEPEVFEGIENCLKELD